jgi:hypothetical protein
MRVFENKHYTLHYIYGASTIIIARTNRIGPHRSMLRDDLWSSQTKCELFVMCSLPLSQARVHWSWRLKTASRHLKEHSRTVKQCHISWKPQIHFVWICGYNKLNKSNDGDLVFADVSIYPGVSWIHTMRRSFHLCCPCYSIHTSSLLNNILEGLDRTSLEMHLKAKIKWTERFTWRPWSIKFGDSLGGHDWGSLEESLEVVDLEGGPTAAETSFSG